VFWAAVAGYCHFRGLLDNERLDRAGLKHTDQPCLRCALDPWRDRMRDATLRALRERGA